MIDWNDNAKAAVNTYNDWALENDLGIHAFFEHLTNNSHTQTKTVADAYEWAKGEWKHGMLAICRCNDNLFFCDNNLRMREVICTREQFEAYAKKQDGKKCTHIYDGVECSIKVNEPDCDGYLMIVTKGGRYLFCTRSELKPIKPTLTKEQHELLCKFSADINNLEVTAEVESYLAKHDII